MSNQKSVNEYNEKFKENIKRLNESNIIRRINDLYPIIISLKQNDVFAFLRENGYNIPGVQAHSDDKMGLHLLFWIFVNIKDEQIEDIIKLITQLCVRHI